MSRSKNRQKHGIKRKEINKGHSFNMQARRCSMKVNLSYTSDLEYSLLKSTSIESIESVAEEPLLYCNNVPENVETHIFKESSTTDIGTNNDFHGFLYHSKEPIQIENSLLIDIKEKEQQLNRSCMQLKYAIMNKTKALFDKKNELSIKTSKVLATGCNYSIDEIIDLNNKRSPSIKVNIGKNDQIIMSGDGRRNPVQVNSMLNHSLDINCYKSSKKTNEEYLLYNQSIISTPKKSITNRYRNRKEISDKTPTILKVPVTRLFNDNDSMKNISECEISHELCCTSPILSQGIKKSKCSKLSLKKKSANMFSDTLSSNIINTNVCDNNMFVCSSFNDKQSIVENEICAMTNKEKQYNVDNNNINLVNKDNNKTISISSNSNQSNMEFTTIISHVPIICKSFQDIHHVVINNMPNACDGIRKHNLFMKESIIYKNKILNKKVNNSELLNQIAIDNSIQNTPLEENVISDHIKLIGFIIQKENKIPNIAENKIFKNRNKHITNAVVNEQSDIYSISSSMQVCNSKSDIKKIIASDKLINSDKIICLKSNIDINPEKTNNEIRSRQESTSTIRSSMQVNTSLDSIRKSPIIKAKLSFNNILSIVQESSSNISKHNIATSISNSLNYENVMENICLMDRIANISKIKTINKKKLRSMARKCTKVQNHYLNTNKNFTEYLSIDSNSLNNSIINKNTSLISDDSNIIQATPFPTSRSVLTKSTIKNCVTTNTINPQRLLNSLLDNEESNYEFQTITDKKKEKAALQKNKNIVTKEKVTSLNTSYTTILNSSNESLDEIQKEKKLFIVNESLNEMKNCNQLKSKKTLNIKQKNKRVIGKRKLYPLQKNSELMSFTPTDIQDLSQEKKILDIKLRNQNIKQNTHGKTMINKRHKSINEAEPFETEIMPIKVEKKKKKNRKIIRKKIIVKKITNLTILEDMICNEEKLSEKLNDRNSLKEFDLKNIKSHKKGTFCKNNKIIIVVTGLSKEEKDLVKTVIKTLGSATLEINVTSRTTHVISSGIRTINLLKGIVRGCWLLSLEWALKSLENERWLDPIPYEMIYFAKSVQENRRDRHLFGKAYVPELFVTCGMIYIENGTTPSASSLKELIKIAGGRITEDPNKAEIIIGLEGLKEIWILDSIITGEVQSIEKYKRN